MVVFLDWGFCWKKLWLTCIQTWRKDMHGDVWGCPLPEVYPEPWLGSRWLSYCEQVWNDKGDKLHETNLISSSLGPIVFAPAAAVDVAQWGGNWYGNIVINFQLMIPTCSMCGIFTFSCHTYIVNVGKHIPVPWNIWDLLGQQNLATLLATTAEVLPSLCPWHGLCLIGRCGHPLGHSLGWRTIGTLSLQGRCLRGPLGVSLYQMGMLLVFTGRWGFGRWLEIGLYCRTHAFLRWRCYTFWTLNWLWYKWRWSDSSQLLQYSNAGNTNHSTIFLYSVSASMSVVFFHNGKEFKFRRPSFPLLFSWGSPIIFIHWTGREKSFQTKVCISWS